MKMLMLMMLLLSINFMFMKHPLSMGFILLMQTIFSSLTCSLNFKILFYIMYFISNFYWSYTNFVYMYCNLSSYYLCNVFYVNPCYLCVWFYLVIFYPMQLILLNKWHSYFLLV